MVVVVVVVVVEEELGIRGGSRAGIENPNLDDWTFRDRNGLGVYMHGLCDCETV